MGMRLARILSHRALKRMLEHAASGRRGERRLEERRRARLIQRDRLVEKRLLVTEGGIQARHGDSHGLGKLAHRCLLEAVLPEHEHGGR
jgi:hypothetical protein